MNIQSTVLKHLTRFSDALMYPKKLNHYLELLNPLWNAENQKARVVDIIQETADAVTLILKPNAQWHGHQAGQHAMFQFESNGRFFKRTYTISSAPNHKQKLISITVKAMKDGIVSQGIIPKLKIGQYVTVSPPDGDFVLPQGAPNPILFITGGSGITPVASMVRDAVNENHILDCVHLHYDRRREDFVFAHELTQISQKHERYQLKPIYTTDSAVESDSFFSASQLQHLCPDWLKREIYVCGPSTLVQAVKFLCQEHQRLGHLHKELFTAAFAKLPENIEDGQVSFTKSDLSVKASGTDTLLHVAESQGLNPKHGCRMGICLTCNCKLVSGCVRDLRTGEIVNEAGRDIQICVSAAAGDCSIEI